MLLVQWLVQGQAVSSKAEGTVLRGQACLTEGAIVTVQEGPLEEGYCSLQSGVPG